MAQIAMNELTTFRWSFDEDVRQYVAANYDGIGIWRQKLADFGEEKGSELVRDSQIEVSSLHCECALPDRLCKPRGNVRSLPRQVEPHLQRQRRSLGMCVHRFR